MSIKILRGIALCLIFSLLAIAIYARQETITLNDLPGRYIIGHTFGGSMITLEKDGSFRIDSADCTQEYHEAGTYILNADVLSLTTTKFTVTDHNGVDMTKFFPAGPTKDSKPQEFLPIRWGSRLYLIAKDDLENFCDAINLGL